MLTRVSPASVAKERRARACSARADNAIWILVGGKVTSMQTGKKAESDFGTESAKILSLGSETLSSRCHLNKSRLWINTTNKRGEKESKSCLE